MPKAFQDSDLSSDDEPAELQVDEELYADGDRETLWTQEEIDRLGFDPDHIPPEWIYGDLLGQPDAVKPEVKSYNSRQKHGGGGGVPGDVNTVLDSDDWHDFIYCKTKNKTGKEETEAANAVKQALRKLRTRSSTSRSSSTSLAKARKMKKAGKGTKSRKKKKR